MKTQKEKMFDGEPYDAHCEEMINIRTRVKGLLHKLNVTEYYTDKFQDIMNELCPNSASNIHLEPPFYCDYGDHIYAGDKVFINFGAVILDGAKVTIGARTLIAPGVHIYTAQHPLDADERDQWENCSPVTIGERCWIGGHVTICPGVTIGDRCVIGAGSVVVKDIPADSLAVGNPARVVRKLNNAEGEIDTYFSRKT
jgi:maltose O-acetyltransferase